MELIFRFLESVLQPMFWTGQTASINQSNFSATVDGCVCRLSHTLDPISSKTTASWIGNSFCTLGIDTFSIAFTPASIACSLAQNSSPIGLDLN
jgi:hypothetical protein